MFIVFMFMVKGVNLSKRTMSMMFASSIKRFFQKFHFSFPLSIAIANGSAKEKKKKNLHLGKFIPNQTFSRLVTKHPEYQRANQCQKIMKSISICILIWNKNDYNKLLLLDCYAAHIFFCHVALRFVAFPNIKVEK